MGINGALLCMMIAAVMFVVEVVSAPTPEVTVRFASRDSQINTATCATDQNGVPSKGINSIALITNLMMVNHRGYLAKVTLKANNSAQRNKSYSKSLAARGWLNKNDNNASLNIGFVQSTSLNLESDGAKCKYGIDVNFTILEAKTTSLPAKVMTWEIHTPSEPKSAVIELQENNGVRLFEYGDGKRLDSMEFLEPQQVHNPTMYIWRRAADGSKLTLTVIALSNFDIAARASSFKCRVRTGDVVTECVDTSPPTLSANHSQDGGLQGRKITVIVVVVVLLAIAGIVVVLAIFAVRRRRRHSRSRSPIDDTADNRQNEDQEKEVKAPMNEPVQASEDVPLHDNVGELQLKLVHNNPEDLE